MELNGSKDKGWWVPSLAKDFQSDIEIQSSSKNLTPLRHESSDRMKLFEDRVEWRVEIDEVKFVFFLSEHGLAPFWIESLTWEEGEEEEEI